MLQNCRLKKYEKVGCIGSFGSFTCSKQKWQKINMKYTSQRRSTKQDTLAKINTPPILGDGGNRLERRIIAKQIRLGRIWAKRFDYE